MIFSKISILYLKLLSPGDGVVTINYYKAHVCEQISKWQMEKFPNSVLVIKSPNAESKILKIKLHPFT
jgi:hypothetical protein